jgi:hypothetical protein
MLNSQIKLISTRVLINYVGVAAEFIVSDALKQVEINSEIGGKESYEQALFFQFLKILLPPDLPFEIICSEISSLLNSKTILN